MRPCVATKVALVVATLVACVVMPTPTWATADTKATCETAYFEFWTGEVASGTCGSMPCRYSGAVLSLFSPMPL